MIGFGSRLGMVSLGGVVREVRDLPFGVGEMSFSVTRGKVSINSFEAPLMLQSDINQ